MIASGIIAILLGTKIIADFLWKFKEIQVISILLIVVSVVVNIHVFRFRKEILLLFIIVVLGFLSLSNDYSSENLGLYAKMISAFGMYLLAQIAAESAMRSATKLLCLLSFLTIYLLFVMAAIGVGYQYWGEVYTFSGPYYFKTDVGVSLMISLIFCRLAFYYKSSDRRLLSIVFIVALLCVPYVLLKANTRLFMLQYIVILPVMYYEMRDQLARPIAFRNIAAYVLVGSLVLFALILPAYQSYVSKKGGEILTVDFSGQGLFSESNTQGRSRVWGNVANGYMNGSAIEKVFGFSWSADYEFAKNDDMEYDSHNSYIKLLISCGAVGALSYIAFLFITLKKILRKMKCQHVEKSYIFTALLIWIFLALGGVTTTNLFHTQSSWIAFAYIGYATRSKDT